MLTTRTISTRFKSLLKQIIGPKVPGNISQNFRGIDAKSIEEINASMERHCFASPIWSESRIEVSTSERDVDKRMVLADLDNRQRNFRQIVIPWLNSFKPLMGASVLEIGCGTGSSTVTLAEQGAKVTAVDIDEKSLSVAKDKCRVYGLNNVDFYKANAVEVHQLFSGQHFDIIIFFACLEHMTHDERITAMKNTWSMLSKGDFWCVIDTPNRLWYFDWHTSLLPFYMWLPDDLAFNYSQFSPRQSFYKSHQDKTEDAMLNFLRRGRGLSFHEFDLAIKKVEELDVISSLPMYLRKQNPLWELGKRFVNRSLNYYRYESFLTTVGPKIHPGFYQESLDLIIKKD